MAGAFGRARTRGVAPPFNLSFLAMQTFHRDRKRWRPLRYPVMGWSGRAPAPPASDACAGHQTQGARHGRSAQEFDLLRRHRRWQEFVPRRGSRWGGAIVLRQSTTGGHAQRSPTICKENEMGLLVDGHWHDQWYDTSASGGRFVRRDSVFRNWVTTDGTPGPTGVGGYRAEAGRYHLYVSLACPWAHRTLIFRALKGLTPLIDVSVVHWLMAEQGWSFAAGDGVVPDLIGGAHYLHEVYTRSDPTYSGHVTVPVLWDKKTGTIVNNESSEIIRMFNTAFDGIGAKAGDYYPEALRTEIDGLNARVYAQRSPTICKENEMGLLIDGRWHDQWYDTSASGGRFVRQDSVFRNWVTTDGTQGPTGVGGYRAEAGRYHLYVSLA